MVRIKHRYLLFNILYPTSTSTATGKSADSGTVTSASASTPQTTQLSPFSAPVPKDAAVPPYILFSRPSPPTLSSAVLLSTLRASIQLLFGDHGSSVTQSSLRVVYFSPTTSTGIVRVPRAHVRIVWAGLTFLTQMPDHKPTNQPTHLSRGHGRTGASGSDGNTGFVKCVVRVVRVSGTIKKSEAELLRRARREIVRAKREGRPSSEEQAGKGGVSPAGLGGTVASGLQNRPTTSPQESGIEDLDNDEESDDYDDYDMDDLDEK